MPAAIAIKQTHIFKITIGVRKMQPYSQLLGSKQGRYYFNGYYIALLMRVGNYINRNVFYRKLVVQLVRPHIQLLLYVLDIIDGSRLTVLFDDFKTDITQLQAMGINAKIIACFSTALRLL